MHGIGGKINEKTIVKPKTTPGTRPLSPKEARPQTCKITKKVARQDIQNEKLIPSFSIVSRLSYFDEK